MYIDTMSYAYGGVCWRSHGKLAGAYDLVTRSRWVGPRTQVMLFKRGSPVWRRLGGLRALTGSLARGLAVDDGCAATEDAVHPVTLNDPEPRPISGMRWPV